VFNSSNALYKSLYVGTEMLNQEMHTWIAMVLSLFTIKGIEYYQKFQKNELNFLVFVDLAALLTALAIWFYWIY